MATLHCDTCGRRVDPDAIRLRKGQVGPLVIWRDGEATAWCSAHAVDRPTTPPEPLLPPDPPQPQGLRTGRGCIAHLDQGEKLLERHHWKRYAKSLTPEERRRLAAGDYRALRRRYLPDMLPGDWLEIGSENHKIRVSEIRPRPGGYRVIFDRVQDHRHQPITQSRIREVLDPNVVTTLDIGHKGPVSQPEPPKVPHSVVESLPSTEQARRRYEQVQAEKQRAEAELPLAERLRRLEKAGDKRIHRQLARIEQGITAAENKLRRHNASTSDEAA